jgi:hypothetical protein
MSKLIRWSKDSSANWFPRRHNLVRELMHWRRDSSWNWFEAAHNLLSELIRRRTDLPGNWFAKGKTGQRTDWMHHTTSSSNWFTEAQNRQQPASLHHTTSSRTNSLKQWLVSELIEEAHTHQRTDLVIQLLVIEVIPYTTQPYQRTGLLQHKLISELIR